MVLQLAGDGADGNPHHFALWAGRGAGRADTGMVPVCAVSAEVFVISRAVLIGLMWSAVGACQGGMVGKPVQEAAHTFLP